MNIKSKDITSPATNSFTIVVLDLEPLSSSFNLIDFSEHAKGEVVGTFTPLACRIELRPGEAKFTISLLEE